MSDKIQDLFSGELKVITVGLEHFNTVLENQNVKTEHVDWRPVAGGDKEIARILDTIGY